MRVDDEVFVEDLEEVDVRVGITALFANSLEEFTIWINCANCTKNSNLINKFMT